MSRNGLIALIVGIFVAIGLGLLISEVAIDMAEGEKPVASSGEARVGGPFTLVDQTGKTVTEADFRGRYMLIYFGFTFCPDVCPTELAIMAAALDALGDDAEKVQPIFITVDPERDTPEVMARYVPLFHPRLIGLTGSPEQIAEVANAYHVFYRKAEDESSSQDYTMDHSSIVFLMGPDGEYLKLFPPATAPEKMAADIASHIE
ncbi:Classical-complement-pathway C3/C5 convertase [Parvibaculum lavamentivorans DS-1]|uniref:Classical-complement-pathway C3/C5 convertase n=1 Tax=Parvibaculum lavamentivorans (strain DS-1 / DSM 13023 / NCIMB 13966) TaxID=402881 RepID=A7HP04_PARL1|nr:SCO family protein [Parvibaculum lavamentivorans]ABS61637.1 Classical-complement-pathway C3/C5 convertase [Parvibaculum lavamentivorans DS-1]